MAMKEEEGGVIRTKRRAKNDINDERVQCILSLSLSLRLFLSFSLCRSSVLLILFSPLSSSLHELILITVVQRVIQRVVLTNNITYLPAT